MVAQNMFNSDRLADDLAAVRRDIEAVTLVVAGRGRYPAGRPVPSLRSLHQREADLLFRLDVLGGFGNDATGESVAK